MSMLLQAQGDTVLRVAALGDVGVIGSARVRAARESYAGVLSVPASTLKSADLGFANLEFPVATEAQLRPGRAREFRHDREIAAALAASGVQIVSLANNHMMDAGPEGLRATLDACRDAGLRVAGAGTTLAEAEAPIEFECAGRRVALLACTQCAPEDAATSTRPGVAAIDPERLRASLTSLRTRADIVVVSAHWGSMYVDFPHPRTRPLARLFSECGVDLVLGHHAHVLQGVERVGRTLVLYSLGDGVFNSRSGDFHAQVAAAKRVESGVFVATLAREAHGVELVAHRLDDDGLPVALDAAGAAAIVERVHAMSGQLNDAEARFAEESAPTLLRYGFEGLGQYVRQGRWDKVVKVLASVRPRHLPVIWNALVHRRRS